MFGVKLGLWKTIGLLTVIWKTSLIVQKLMRDEGMVPPVRVESGLGRVWNGDGTFNIMNRVSLKDIHIQNSMIDGACFRRM